jgi:hypothetical protein
MNKMPDPPACAPVCVLCLGDGFNPDGGVCPRCHGSTVDPDPRAPAGIVPLPRAATS